MLISYKAGSSECGGFESYNHCGGFHGGTPIVGWYLFLMNFGTSHENLRMIKGRNVEFEEHPNLWVLVTFFNVGATE